jgi:hypothetical protein
MSKANEDIIFINIGRIRRRKNQIIEGRDSNFLLIEIVLIDIRKIILLRMNPRWNNP